LLHNKSAVGQHMFLVTLPYLTAGMDKLLHLPSAEAISAWPNARPRM